MSAGAARWAALPVSVAAGIGLVLAASWAVLLMSHPASLPAWCRPGSAGGGTTAAMWVLMMAGMMLPGVAPMLLAHARVLRQRGRSQLPTAAFAGGYFVIWSLVALLGALLQSQLLVRGLLDAELAVPRPLAAALLVTAGLFQFSGLKDACLRHCRSPLGFLLTEWRDGLRGGLRMGLQHGVVCVACCWALMGLMFVAGVMNLLWMAALSLLMLLEKAAPGGRWIARLAGLSFLGGGLTLALLALPGG